MKKALLCLNNYHRDGEVLLKMQFFSVWTQKNIFFSNRGEEQAPKVSSLYSSPRNMPG